MKKVETKYEFDGVPAGLEGKRGKEDGQVVYTFTPEKNKHVTFSWSYIKNNKDYFSITKTKGD